MIVTKIPIFTLFVDCLEDIKTSYSFCKQHYYKKNMAQYLKGYKDEIDKITIMDRQHS